MFNQVRPFPPRVVKQGSFSEKINFLDLLPPTMSDFPRLIVIDTKKLKTYVSRLAAVKEEGCALKFVPSKFMSQELCLAAVMNNRYAFDFVPARFKTLEFMEKLNASTSEFNR